MLLELSITDFAIIERTSIHLSEGLNALTGETGAGKSILIDALGAVLGARVSSDFVRTGAKLARVEAAFDIRALDGDRLRSPLLEIGIDPEPDEALILSREIQANGRSSARINGQLTTALVLSRIGALLVDIHGQSDHLSILKAVEQRNLLDRYGSLEEIRNEIASEVRDWRGVRGQIERLSRDSREREQHVDLLRFQVEEISSAALHPGEDSSLATERDVIRHAEQLRTSALEALISLSGDDLGDRKDVTTMLRAATTLTASIASLDGSANDLDERANELLVLAEDLARDLRNYAEGIDPDELRLSGIEDRLALIQVLKRKYGSTIQEVIDFEELARVSLAELSSGEFDVNALLERERALGGVISRQVAELSTKRQIAAATLAAAIEESISELNMGRAHLRIAVQQREDATGLEVQLPDGKQMVHIDETGIDDIEFLIAPNVGEALKPLSKIASGGETARLMLATKSILSDVDLTPTLVFDEIDVGVGGRSGQVVGEKLWNISRKHQVIVVTHLPQVAALAETHLRIQKHTSDGRTVSDVRTLDGHDRELELAVMIDGLPPGEAAKLNAKTMLERSRDYIVTSQ